MAMIASALPAEVDVALSRVARIVERAGRAWVVDGAGLEGGSLADALYRRWYVRTGGCSVAEGDPPLHRETLLGALRAAHAAAARVEAGWVVVGVEPDGQVSAARGEEVVVLAPGEYRAPLRPGVPPAPGEPLEVVARRDHHEDEHGMWWSFSARMLEAPLGRVYLNARAACVPRALREVTAALQGWRFRLKCPATAAACARVDTIVVYHEQGVRDDVLEALLEREEALEELLAPEVPPLTCPVRSGLAWADDPGDETSFGQSRCAALAQTLEDLGAAWSSLPETGRVVRLAAGLRARGIDPRAPWVVAA